VGGAQGCTAVDNTALLVYNSLLRAHKIIRISIFDITKEENTLMKKSAVNDINEQIKPVIEAIQHLSEGLSRPVVAAIDGASGSGKSTIAQLLCDRLPAALTPLDDFFSAEIPDGQWDKFSVKDKLEKVFDWNKARSLALEPLRNNLQAKWHPFDFLAGIQKDGVYSLKNEETILNPSKIIILEGAYSSGSFLADLLDVTILIDVPAEERHKRLAMRDDSDFLKRWHQRWDAVEAYYFGQVRQKKFFDWVVENN
jgi:uridine kinase